MSRSRISASMTSNRISFAHALVLTAGLALSSSLAFTPASQASANKLVFDRVPRLVSASKTQPAAFINGGTYEFTLIVPRDAAPLQAVTISQAANAYKIEFALDRSEVVANGTIIPTSRIGGTNSDDLTIAFDRPIQPGSTVTLSLPVRRNTGKGGIYLFGVTAYSTENAIDGLFLGYGRVTLHSQDG